jgi:hypothetical protein
MLPESGSLLLGTLPSAVYRVLNKKFSSSVTLGEVRLSAKTFYVQCKALDIDKLSINKALSNVKLSAKGRQQSSINGR